MTGLDKKRKINYLNIIPEAGTQGEGANPNLCILGWEMVANILNAPVMEENASKESWRKEWEAKQGWHHICWEVMDAPFILWSYAK